MSIPNLSDYSDKNLAARLELLKGSLTAARDEWTRHKIQREIRDVCIEQESRLPDPEAA